MAEVSFVNWPLSECLSTLLMISQQCWPRSLSPYGVPWPQWVKTFGPTFCRWHFELHVLKKYVYWLKLHWGIYPLSKWPPASIGLGTGLAPYKPQASTWTINDSLRRRISMRSRISKLVTSNGRNKRITFPPEGQGSCDCCGITCTREDSAKRLKSNCLPHLWHFDVSRLYVFSGTMVH